MSDISTKQHKPAPTRLLRLSHSLADDCRLRFVVVFAVLLALNWSVLSLPPYWDAVIGLFNQASWLEQHDFSLYALLQQPGYQDGGPNVRPMNLLATTLALLYGCLPPKAVFVVCHVATIAAAALAISLLFAMLKRHVSTKEAALWCAAGAFNPIFAGQTASIYLEIPLALTTVLVLFFTAREKYFWAMATGVLGCGVKSVFALVGATLLVWVVYRVLCSVAIRKERFNKRVLLLLAVPLISISASVLQNAASGIQLGVSTLRIPSFAILELHATQFFPDQIALLAGSLVLAILYLVRRREWSWRWFDLTFLLAVGVWGFWAFYALYFHPLPRYSTMSILPLMGLVGLLASKVVGRRPASVLAVMVIIWGCVNQQGRLLPAPLPQRARSGDFLERSCEYLVDQRAALDMCRLIETQFRDTVVVAKYPFVQMLTMPELGYVKEALPHVRALGRVPTYAPCEAFTPDDLTETVTCVYAPTAFEDSWPPSMKPPPFAEVIYRDPSFLSGDLIAYQLPRSAFLIQRRQQAQEGQ